MVDRVERSRHIEEAKQANAALIRRSENVRQYFQYGRLRRVPGTKAGLEFWKKMICFQIGRDLSVDYPLNEL